MVQRREGTKEEAGDRSRETRSEGRELGWGQGGVFAVIEKEAVFRIKISKSESQDQGQAEGLLTGVDGFIHGQDDW